MEQGKDVICSDKSGDIHAYQLKTGNINLSVWRTIRGEIQELIEIPVVHPSVSKDVVHRAYLVCNGELTDEVRIQIDQINADNIRKSRNYAYLDVLTFTNLLEMFVDAQRGFLPNSIEDFNAFLSLYLSDGRDCVDKTALAKFLKCTVLCDNGSTSDKTHAVSSSIILLSHLLKPFQDAKNHMANFEAWGLLASEIVVFAELNSLNKGWKSSLNLALEESVSSLLSLKDEALQREDFLEGDLLGDGKFMYRGRITCVLGLLAFLELYLLDLETNDEPDARIVELIGRNIDNLWLWGDSAVPYMLNLVWLFEKADEFETAEAILTKVFVSVLDSNSREHDGKSPLASPYYLLSDVLETIDGLAEAPIDFESFTMSSYCLDVLIQTIARRQHRLLLELNWRRATHIHVQEFVPKREIEMLSWCVEEGKNKSYYLPQTQSRRDLIKVSQRQVGGILTKYKTILQMFILIAPHRMTTNTAAIIDPIVEKV